MWSPAERGRTGPRLAGILELMLETIFIEYGRFADIASIWLKNSDPRVAVGFSGLSLISQDRVR